MERKSLESAAANYSYLRGLFSVPVGVLVVLAGMANLDWLPQADLFVWIGMLAAGVACLLINRYYTETYGRVALSTRAHVKMTATVALSVGLAVGGVQTDWTFDLAINATAAAMSLLMLAGYAIGIGLRVHHIVICGLLLAAGLLPVWGQASSDMKINVGLQLMGVTAIVLGVFDHFALKRTLGPSDES